MNHETIKNAIDVLSLNFDFKPSTYILAGIGESFHNLKSLWISYQTIKLIDSQDFIGLTKLEELDLYSNRIEFLPEDAFLDLFELNVLNLSKNEIKNFPEKIFNSLKKLRQIYFRDNNIEYLPKNLFADNLELVTVQAHNNHLKVVDADFTDFGKLKVLDLRDNECVNIRAENKAQVQEAQQIINRNCTSLIH